MPSCETRAANLDSLEAMIMETGEAAIPAEVILAEVILAEVIITRPVVLGLDIPLAL